ncbi:MAG: hypothetical protein ACOC33_00210 [bacterium]
MAFLTKVEFSDRQQFQETGDTINLSGTTNFSGVLQSKGIEIDGTVTGASQIGHVLGYDGSKIKLIPQSGGTGTGSTSNGTIGEPTDGTYSDGFFNSWTSATTVANAFDDVNELFLLFINFPPSVNNITNNSNGQSVKLSFGSSKSITDYTNVSVAAGNTSVNNNGTYSVNGTRLGAFGSSLSDIQGVINQNVGDNLPSYSGDSFRDANRGLLKLEINGSIVDTLDLTTSTGSTNSSNGWLTVSETFSLSSPTGNELSGFVYRTGSYDIPVAEFNNGFNYIRIYHDLTGTTATTNYLEFVYDPDGSSIGFVGTPSIFEVNLSGATYLSGIEYYTGGRVRYSAETQNLYRDVYDPNDVISFPSRTNLSDFISMNKTGSGFTDQSNVTTRTLPELNNDVGSELTRLKVDVLFQISATKLLGTNSNGTISTNSFFRHPLKTDLLGGTSTLTGFLLYDVSQSSDNESENFNGEILRIQDLDYTTLTYGDIDSGNYDWDSTESLIGTDSGHNTGLLVFDGHLVYPSSSWLTNVYGITSGNFSSITYQPVVNQNYSTASGVRRFIRRFKSNNTSTLAQLQMVIETISGYSIDLSDILTDGNDSGTPSGDQIKVEFLIKRLDGSTYGWYNPFAQSSSIVSGGNDDGVAVQSSSKSGQEISVTTSLAATPRIGDGDIVIVRIKAASDWSNVITRLELTNI